jgi:hypothetical protein
MAGTAPNIVLRKGTYYVRVQVPVDVQSILGKREFWESLRTSNFHDAKKASLPIIAKFKREIAAARNSAYGGRGQAARNALASWAVTRYVKLDWNMAVVRNGPPEIVFERRHIDLNKQYVFLRASPEVLDRLLSIDWDGLGRRTTAATPNFCKGDVVAAYEALSANIAATTRKPQPVGGGPRWKPREDDFGLAEAKFKYRPKEIWLWAA